MQAYVIEKTLMENGKLILSGLPFKTDEHVQIIILHKSKPKEENSFPLKGKLLKYESPFEPVALEDWKVLK